MDTGSTSACQSSNAHITFDRPLLTCGYVDGALPSSTIARLARTARPYTISEGFVCNLTPCAAGSATAVQWVGLAEPAASVAARSGDVTASIDVVIVNWNSGSLLRECVGSLVAADPTGALLNVIVVDNASTDSSADGLPAEASWTPTISNLENRGFAAACNQGAAAGTSRYVLFLNPDTRVEQAALNRVLAFMDASANQQVGIAGIQLLDAAGAVARSCSRHPTPARMIGALFFLDRLLPGLLRPHLMREWDHGNSRDVEQIIGAFYFVRRELFQLLGGFDEQFFVYYEEVDFARRAEQRGYRTHYLSDVRAFHMGGGTTNVVRALRLFLVTQSRVLYAFKHFPWPIAAVHACGALTVEPLLRSLYFALLRDTQSMKESLLAARLLWRGAFSLMRGIEAPGTRPSVALPWHGR